MHIENHLCTNMSRPTARAVCRNFANGCQFKKYLGDFVLIRVPTDGENTRQICDGTAPTGLLLGMESPSFQSALAT